MKNDNKLFHDRYFLERLLGRGGFSEVWQAKDTKTDAIVALKIFAPSTGLDDDGLKVFSHEFSLVVDANHKNLLKPLHYDSFDRKPYLVLPFCKKGSIIKMVGQFNEEQAWTLLRDVASGLACLHSMSTPVIHQDIKPDNIMVGEMGQYMITDFGVSAHIKSTLRKSMSSAFYSAGTRAYMAPERFGSDVTPVMANDIYSLGATVFEMLSGNVPFGEDGGLVHKQCKSVPVLKGNFSEQLKRTIYKCLNLNPWDRPSAEQLVAYAETALKGEKIKFVDEKTFFQKNKIAIFALSFVLLVAITISVFSVIRHIQKKMEMDETRKILLEYVKKRNFIILAVNTVGENIYEGDKHNEGYESAYILAYQILSAAMDSAKTLPDGMYDSFELAQLKDSLALKLSVAYNEFVAKAQKFSDDPEVAASFNVRADAVKDCIGAENIRLDDSLKNDEFNFDKI